MYFLLKTLQCVSIALHSSPHKALFTYSATLHTIYPLFMKFNLQVFSLSLWRICAIGPPVRNPPILLLLNSWFSCLRIQLKCDLLRDIPLPLYKISSSQPPFSLMTLFTFFVSLHIWQLFVFLHFYCLSSSSPSDSKLMRETFSLISIYAVLFTIPGI